MKRVSRCRSIAVAALLAAALLLGGCAQEAASEESPNESQAQGEAPADASESEDSTEEAESDPVDPQSGQQEEPAMDSIQLNSLAMLNHLAVLMEQIENSKGSRIALEEAYLSLLNNTYPNAVDDRTLVQLESTLDTLEEYRMIAVKRERLAYLYEQNKAQAIREALPNPLSLLSAVQSNGLAGIAASVAYMAADSVTSYGAAVDSASFQALSDGWELDDEEAKILHDRRKSMFAYTVGTVRDYDLPGELALSEEAVRELAAWLANDNAVSRAQWLEAHEATYSAYGGYWLALAKCYYELGKQSECISAVEEYESLKIGIFRKDTSYASILPLAISAAAETMSAESYIDYAEKRVEALLDNCASDDWASRYFAAQTYIDLAAQTGDRAYLLNAYDIVLNNVNELVGEQLDMNDEYESELAETEALEGMTKEQKDEVKEYNKMRKDARKTELPPAHMPLLVNCELLFALADELGVSESEMEKIEGILHRGGESAFITISIGEKFGFDQKGASSDGVSIDAGGTRIEMPASYASELVEVEMLINGKIVPGSWTVKKVVRDEEGNAGAFTVEFENKEAKGRFSNGDEVIVLVKNSFAETEHCFKASVGTRPLIIPDAIDFEPMSR